MKDAACIRSKDNKVHTMATKQKKQEKTPAPAPGVKPGSAAPTPPGGFLLKARSLGQYFEDAKTELGKVSWPTKKEIKATSIAVLMLVIIMSCFLGLVDVVLSKLVGVILSKGV